MFNEQIFAYLQICVYGNNQMQFHYLKLLKIVGLYENNAESVHFMLS